MERENYFYMGLFEDEQKEESLRKIKETNQEYIGDVVYSKGDYVIRDSPYGTYPVLEERWDGCAENFIVEVRNLEQSKEFLHLYLDKKITFKEVNEIDKDFGRFCNHYGNSHTKVVDMALRMLKSRKNLNPNES